jgi:hypothetical protein
MRAKIVSLFLILAGPAIVNAQSPAPVIVQPANAPAASLSAPKTTVAPGAEVQSIPAAIKLLEQLKATNDEVLGKQKAALSKLDELQDSADQLRIFSKRG